MAEAANHCLGAVVPDTQPSDENACGHGGCGSVFAALVWHVCGLCVDACLRSSQGDVGTDSTMGAGGIAENAKPGTVFIDLSTNSPATARKVAAGMAAKGVQMLEAPVSGGTARAADGTIVIMVGGDAKVFEQNLPLLKSFSGEVIHLGEIGYGSTAKLINNMLAFCNSAAAAEALMIGKRSGIDLKKLDAVIRNASGMSAGYANLSTKTLAGDFRPTFALDLAHKDLRLALELADELGVPGLIAPQVMSLMRMARGMGLGSSDSASVVQVYETALGETVRA